MDKNIVFVSDFDGTITKEDFFKMVTTRLLTPAAMAPWDEYLAGRITHVQALNGIFGQVHLTKTELDDFIAQISVDEYFYPTVDFCKSHNIPLYICSAGSRYYIERKMGAYLKDSGITLLANGGSYSQDTGLSLIPPPPSDPFYSENLGVSKELLVQHLKERGYTVIYAGDGKPDLQAAQAADVVFAKDALLALCRETGLKTENFDSFKDILGYMEGIYAAE
ncbi:2(,)3-diketo-5-methylthio-1-phosphopentane phosphatase [Elusimicrobium simillimum]|uniref:MtnX-like HAD-IB family phosphatase n=1 Tax=Elusimicrobium simillimum TaxID=3143438 RepID=UPI003C702D41